MNAPTTQPAMSPAGTDASREPVSKIPVILVVLMFLLMFWGWIYFDEHGGWFNSQVYAPFESSEQLDHYLALIQNGAPTGPPAGFKTICAQCHGDDGMGKPGTAPPLAGSEWVQGPANRVIRIPLYGLGGPIQVGGKDYAMSMGAMGASLSSEELAAVLTYIRSSFGNKAEPVTAAQVDAVRKEVGNHPPFTPDVLQNVK